MRLSSDAKPDQSDCPIALLRATVRPSAAPQSNQGASSLRGTLTSPLPTKIKKAKRTKGTEKVRANRIGTQTGKESSAAGPLMDPCQ